jgi:Protein of unknown function (DUF3263)
VSGCGPILHFGVAAGQTVSVDVPDDELTDRQRELLDFERTWWQFDDSRDKLIRARFGCGPDEYDAELDQVLEHPGAMRHDPLVVRRFQRRRLRRRRVLNEGPEATPDTTDGATRSPRHHHGGA